MADENEIIDSGSETSEADVSNLVGGDDDASGHQGGEGTTSGDEHHGESEPRRRSLAELRDAASGDAPYSDEEAEAIRIALEEGFETDEEIDRFLKKHKKVEKKAKTDADTSDADEGDDEETPQEDDDDSEADDESDEEESSDLPKFVKELFPNAKSSEQVRGVVKNLRQKLNEQGASLRELAPKVEQYERSLEDIDTQLENRIKTPEGLKELVKAYMGEIPSWLSINGQAGTGASEGQGAHSDLSDADLLKELGVDDGEQVVDAATAIKLARRLATAQAASLEERILLKAKDGALKDVQPLLKKIQEERDDAAFKERQRSTLDEVKQMVSFKKKYGEAVSLKSDPADVWAKSTVIVGKDEKGMPIVHVADDPHPEWEALRDLLTVRAKAYQERHANPIAYLAYLRELNGDPANREREVRREAAKDLINKKLRNRQPAPQRRSKGNPKTPFRPKTADDIANASEEQRQEFMRDVESGRVTVRL